MNTATDDRARPLWWQRPFDRTTLLVVALPSGAILWNAIFPGFYYMVLVGILALYWLGLGAFFLVRASIASTGAHLTGRPVLWEGWRGVIALMSVVSVAIAAKLPLHAAFAFA